MLIIDFETRSYCNLNDAGAYKYAEHPTTEIIMLGYGFSDGKHTYIWTPGEKMPAAVMDYLNDDTLPVAAHNAIFDWLIWNNVMVQHGFPPLKLERMRCTEALCRVNGLPAKLDLATRAMNLPHKKDPQGTRLISQMCIPPYDESPALKARMASYCAADIEATRGLINALRPLNEMEQQDWIVNAQINSTGVLVDTYMATLAVKYADAGTEDIAGKLDKLTYGAVTKHTQHARVKQFVLPLLSPKQLDIVCTDDIKKGEVKVSMDADKRERLLADHTLDEQARGVLELVDAGSKSSVAKYKTMLDMADEGMIRGAFVYFGAGQTGRYSARGLQLHNFPRNAFTPSEAEALIDTMEAGDPIVDTMATLSRALRSAIVPDDGNVLVVSDWSSIEAGALPWLADDLAAQPKLDALAAGKDIYNSEFTGWHGDERQIHKVIELSLGYGGHIGAFASMARNYGVSLPEDEIFQIVKQWRQRNRWAVRFWHDCLNAAKQAMKHPNALFKAGRLVYSCVENYLGAKTLFCTLPDGTILTYPFAILKEIADEDGGLYAMRSTAQPKRGETEWPEMRLWHGLLAENATQGVCASLLRSKLRELCTQHSGLMTVVAHVHDEIVVEVEEDRAEEAVIVLKDVMQSCPDWALKLPLRAKPVIMDRYGKA